MRVTYLSVAVLDLAEIRSYIAVDTPDTAQQIGNQLAQAINRLSTFPNLGKPGRVEGTRELITPKLGRTAYVIVYEFDLSESKFSVFCPECEILIKSLKKSFLTKKTSGMTTKRRDFQVNRNS